MAYVRPLWFFFMFSLLGCQHVVQKPIELADGIYWSSDYSIYLEVEGNVAVRYQWTPATCYTAFAGLIPVAVSPGRPAGQHEWASANRQSIVLRRLSDGMPVHFSRVDALPTNCKTPPVDTAEVNLEVLRQNMEQFHHSIDRRTFEVLSNEVEVLDTTQIHSDLVRNLSLFRLLSAALDTGDDEHAYLLAMELHRYHNVSQFKVDEAGRELARAKLVTALRNSDMQEQCGEALWYGLLENNQYYIVSLRLHSLTLDSPYSPEGQRCLWRAFQKIEKDLHDVILRNRRKPDLLVDLRYNEGGSLLLASQFANSLRDSKEPLATIKEQPIYFRLPVNLQGLYEHGTVLITEITASAAEHLANTLQIRGFKLVGQNTRGAFSPTIVRTLPNGWVMGLSMYSADTIRDSRNRVLPEKTGLVPDCYLSTDNIFRLIPNVLGECETSP